MPKAKLDSKEVVPAKAPKVKKVSTEDAVKQTRFTVYEKTRLLATRALQLSDNAPSYINPEKGIDSYSLAKEEFEEGKMPLKISKKN